MKSSDYIQQNTNYPTSTYPPQSTVPSSFQQPGYNFSEAPPPYSQNPLPSGQCPASTVYVYNQTYPCKPAPSPSSGLFGSRLGGAINSVFGTIDSVVRKVDDELSKISIGDLVRYYFVTGNQIQIISKDTGRCLQIMFDSCKNSLIVDFNGNPETMAFNTIWTVYVDHGMHIQLYNQDNYLAVMNESLVLLKAPYPTATPITTKFIIRQTGYFFGFESVHSLGNYITRVANDATIRKEFLPGSTSNFSVKLIRR